MPWKSRDESAMVREVRELVAETEGYADALNYVDEIASDLSLDVELVKQELQRQLGVRE